jgi:hypothetical protein
MRWTIPAFLALTSCHNACQDICFDMRDYAEQKCDMVVPDGDLDACLAGEAGDNSSDDRQACRQYNNQRSIDEEWGCDELRDYFATAE